MAYCYRHKEIPAASRCHNCLKPICKDCIVQMQDHKFCSVNCGQKYFEFMEKKESFEERSRFFKIRNTLFLFLKKISWIIILAIIIYITYKTGWLGVLYDQITRLW